jgi:hypothetical protein
MDWNLHTSTPCVNPASQQMHGDNEAGDNEGGDNEVAAMKVATMKWRR